MKAFLTAALLLGAIVVNARQPTFRAGVRLVNVTVIAQDSSGRPVRDLRAADFRVFEDGKEQKIEVVAIDDGSLVATRPPAPPAGAPASTVFTNVTPRRSAGGITVILFDRLNSEFADQKSARDQIVKMLAAAAAEDRIALYVLESDTITVLHDFTSATRRLVAVLNKYLGATSIEVARSEEKVPDFATTGDAAEDAATAAWLQSTMVMVAEQYLRRRAELTTNALESIANHLAGTPGRKNLVWVSGAFPLVVPSDHGPQVMSTQVNRATRAINAADVAVYPVDIRGLVGAFANPGAATATIVPGGNRGPAFTTMATTHPAQDTMRQIAQDTGGRVYINTNDIGGAVRHAIDDSRVSYVLGYYSPKPDSDQKFRTISVRVSRPGVDLRYRKGYLPPAPVTITSRARLNALARVLQSPVEAASIPLAAEVSRMKDDGTVVVRIDPESLTWVPGKNGRDAVVDIVIALSTPDGKYLKVKETTVTMTADAERYQQMVDDGLTVSTNFTVAKEAYRLHVIVSDVASQSVGSLIIPITK